MRKLTPEEREDRKARGICTRCLRNVASGRVRCKKHLDQANKYMRQRAKQHREAGICTTCKEPAAEGHVLCQGHLDAQRVRPPPPKPSAARKTRQAALANGQCPGIGIDGCLDPVSPGKKLCSMHLRAQADKIKDFRTARKKKGLCWRCPNPSRRGGVLCEDCRKKVRDKERLAREERCMAPVADGRHAAQRDPASEPLRETRDALGGP